MRASVQISACLLLCAMSLMAAPRASAGEPYEEIKQKEIDELEYDDVSDDSGFVGGVAANFEHLDETRKKSLDEWKEKLESWEPGKEELIGQRVRNLLSVCAMADICQSEFESEIPHVVFEHLKKEVPKDKLIKACAWVLFKPDDGKVVEKAAELGWEDGAAEMLIRERAQLFAKKLLGRLVGQLPPKDR